MKEIKKGDRYGKWTVMKEIESRLYSSSVHRMVRCRCECGQVKDLIYRSIVSGKSKSCSCQRVQKIQLKWKKRRLERLKKEITELKEELKPYGIK